MKKNTSILITILGTVLLVVGLYMVRAIIDPQGIMKTMPYLAIGLGCGMFGHGLGELYNRHVIGKDPQLAKQMEINKKDERNVMLANTAKAKGFDIMTYVFSALLLAYALMGSGWEIIIPFVVAYLFVEIYAVYSRVKIEREQ